MINYKQKLAPIRAFVFDFDGVMTNGDVWITPDGQTMRRGSSKDGYALQYAVRQGYHVAVITGANAQCIEHRMRSLGVEDVFTGCADKRRAYNAFLNKYGLKDEEVLCMGDDIPDLPLLRLVGVATCPADAAVEVKERVDYISLLEGGKGCVRDVIEQVMRLHGKWMSDQAEIW
ncbi:MAG: HAD hydrolase family protein [Bacteroidales bacterium]|nr:HAD hydrolase family protein [Bacteroidales bacterium]